MNDNLMNRNAYSTVIDVPREETASLLAKVLGITSLGFLITAAGVATALSTYLFTHPDVNGFYTGLQDQPKDQIGGQVQNYFSTNPQEEADLEGIRQPLTDIRERCQWTPLLGQGAA